MCKWTKIDIILQLTVFSPKTWSRCRGSVLACLALKSCSYTVREFYPFLAVRADGDEVVGVLGAHHLGTVHRVGVGATKRIICTLVKHWHHKYRYQYSIKTSDAEPPLFWAASAQAPEAQAFVKFFLTLLRGGTAGRVSACCACCPTTRFVRCRCRPG